MRSEAEIQAMHDHLLRAACRELDRDRDADQIVMPLDELCWVLGHPYCIDHP